jgi:hypothetical protein
MTVVYVNDKQVADIQVDLTNDSMTSPFVSFSVVS